MNGIMFLDSNFSGFFAMINFAFILYLKEKKIIIYTKRYILFQFVIIVLSFSRAAIMAVIFLMLFLFFKRQKFMIKFVLSIVCIISIFLVSNFSFIDVNALSGIDGSGQSKINIFAGTLEYFENASVRQQLIGNGLTSSVGILGIAGHNYISMAIIELGTIFFLLQLILFVFIYFLTRKDFIYILIPYLIAGLSMAPGAIPYFYAIAGMMYITKDYKCLNNLS
jgi:hypothetical protein